MFTSTNYARTSIYSTCVSLRSTSACRGEIAKVNDNHSSLQASKGVEITLQHGANGLKRDSRVVLHAQSEQHRLLRDLSGDLNDFARNQLRLRVALANDRLRRETRLVVIVLVQRRLNLFVSQGQSRIHRSYDCTKLVELGDGNKMTIRIRVQNKFSVVVLYNI